MSSSSGSNLLGSVPPSLPLGFGMLGGLVPVSLPFQFPSLLNFNPTGSGGSGCSNMGSSPATNSGYTLAQSECARAHVRCASVSRGSCLPVFVMWLEFFCLFNLFLQLSFFSSSFSTLHPVLVLHFCHLICSWIAAHCVPVSFHLSRCPPDLFKSLQPGSQVALPPHLQLAFSGKRCKNPPAHCRSLLDLSCWCWPSHYFPLPVFSFIMIIIIIIKPSLWAATLLKG